MIWSVTRVVAGLPGGAQPTPAPPPGSGPPLVIGRDDARRAAADELSNPQYGHAKPSWVSRALSWIGDHVGRFLANLFDNSGNGSGWIVLLLILAVVVVIVVVVRVRNGPLQRAATAQRLLFDEDTPLDAAAYRRAAEGFAADRAWADAIRARLRAIITDLEERTVLDRRPGRTADSAAREAGRSLPGQAAALSEAARIFDDVWYGEATPTEAGYRRLTAIDDAVAETRPDLAATTAGRGAGPTGYGRPE